MNTNARMGLAVVGFLMIAGIAIFTNTNARMGLAVVGFLMIAGIAIFTCAERATSESDEERGLKRKGASEKSGRPSEKSGRQRHRTQPDNSLGSLKGSEETGADKGQAIETP